MRNIRTLLILLITLLSFNLSSAAGVRKLRGYHAESVYRQMNLKNTIDYNVFKKAVEGFNRIIPRKKDIIVIIDYSKKSKEERFFVIDLEKQKILAKSHVSHGISSGEGEATSFSNEIGSNKSSLGFFLTENTYNGEYGYSLRLNGLEKGINDNAKVRSIVLHGAEYASSKYAKFYGRIGRSQGCPAIPDSISNVVIDIIKDGAVMYVHGNDPKYAKLSIF